MIRARLLRDAQASLKRTTDSLAKAPPLHRALGAWLTASPVPGDVLLRLTLQPPPRSYEWVALAGLAEAGAWPVDHSRIDDGLEWLSNVALERVGVPAPVTTDSIAQMGLALAIRRRPQFAQWLECVLDHVPARREPGWARSGASTILRRQDGAPADPALLLALAATGVTESAPSDPEQVLDAMVGSNLPGDPLHALVMLRAFELIQRSAESRPQRLKVFISYCRKDSHWLERLQTHLAPLERDGLIDRWDDTRIGAGQAWRAEIDLALNEAGAAVFLVSSAFVASDFIRDVELPALLARAEKREVRILPVIVGPCLLELTPLNRFASVNPRDRPLMGLLEVEQESVLVDTARAVMSATDRMRPTP